MKQVQGSVRVKITEYVHAWFLLRVSHASFFSFHFLSLSISFPKFTIFCFVTSLHGLQNKEDIYLLRIQKKRTRKQAQKDMKELE